MARPPADSGGLTPSDPVEPRDFAAVLFEQGRGASHVELSEGLHDLVGRVRDTGKKGSISYTLTVEPMKGNDQMLVLKDEIKLRLPEHDRAASLFFTDRNGNLVRNDPNQPSLFAPAGDAPTVINVSRLAEAADAQED